MAGRVNHIGFVKGWDSSSYISFATRLQKQSISLRKHPVLLTHAASRAVLYRIVWLVDAGTSEEHADHQSTGFSLEKYGIITAAHAIGNYDKSGKWTKFNYVKVRQPHLNSGSAYQSKVIAVSEHADLALIEYPVEPLVTLQRGVGERASPRDVVSLWGFLITTMGTAAQIKIL